ncbi:hypothetical protein TIFTF001_037590 [Ficus carica]|uniref:Uncharacterized protein n=1 Tax=Ficus carica TaxID=3494 RepID=A0AA88EA30_FICCA|nr:hypothetical protein TIFTF001_037590 [Ficus carica]
MFTNVKSHGKNKIKFQVSNLPAILDARLWKVGTATVKCGMDTATEKFQVCMASKLPRVVPTHTRLGRYTGGARTTENVVVLDEPEAGGDHSLAEQRTSLRGPGTSGVRGLPKQTLLMVLLGHLLWLAWVFFRIHRSPTLVGVQHRNLLPWSGDLRSAGSA